MDKVPKSKQVDFVRVGAMPNGQNNGDDARWGEKWEKLEITLLF
jgi:hypothetical protein